MILLNDLYTTRDTFYWFIGHHGAMLTQAQTINWLHLVRTEESRLHIYPGGWLSSVEATGLDSY